MTFLSPLLMVGMIALVALLTKSSLEKKSTVAFVNDSKIITNEDLTDSNTIHFEDLSEIGLEKAKIIVSESGHEGLLYIPNKDSINAIAKSVQFFSSESPSMVTISELESLLEKKLQREKMLSLNIDLQKLEESKVNVNISMANFRTKIIKND